VGIIIIMIIINNHNNNPDHHQKAGRVESCPGFLTGIDGDVVAAVRCLQPAGHLLQDGYLTADDHIRPCDVHLHVRVRALIGQAVADHGGIVTGMRTRRKNGGRSVRCRWEAELQTLVCAVCA